jgi:hypothetical protein
MMSGLAIMGAVPVSTLHKTCRSVPPEPVTPIVHVTWPLVFQEWRATYILQILADVTDGLPVTADTIGLFQ